MRNLPCIRNRHLTWKFFLLWITDAFMEFTNFRNCRSIAILSYFFCWFHLTHEAHPNAMLNVRRLRNPATQGFRSFSCLLPLRLLLHSFPPHKSQLPIISLPKRALFSDGNPFELSMFREIVTDCVFLAAVPSLTGIFSTMRNIFYHPFIDFWHG